MISKTYYKGNHSEQSHRTEIHNLMRELFKGRGFDIFQEIKVTEVYGRSRPDFVVMDKVKVLGSIETKNIKHSLEDGRYKKQVDRYSERLPLIFSNYRDFILVVEGRRIFEINDVFDNNSLEYNWEDLNTLVDRFIVYSDIV